MLADSSWSILGTCIRQYHLASQFIEEYLADPDSNDPIPLGASVILLPAGEAESELRRANLEMAHTMIAEGRVVAYRTVGARPASEERLNRKRA